MKPVVVCVFGTRPEAIKMAPVVLALREDPDFDLKVCVTAQHRQMLDQVLDLFGIVPDADLDLMRPGQTLADITSRVLQGLGPVFEVMKPSLVLVHGDTTTTMAASLAAFYGRVPVGHVEAGLRTETLDNPFPEEMNRRVTSRLAALHFAPTPRSEANLLAEAVDPAGIYLTGNTVIDALLATAARHAEPASDGRRRLLVTAHRRENWGQPMEDICHAVRDLVEAYPDLEVVFPAHLNPLVQDVARRVLGDHPRVQIIAPLDYEPFVQAMQEATLILTDSGGVQEEAPSLGKPVLVMRTTTERPEAVVAGTVRLVGVKREDIVRHARELLDDAAAYERMARSVNPYGDGRAAARIREAVRHFLGLRSDRPLDRFHLTETLPTPAHKG
ncbi:MAG: UDP-N-acetylglucosamine 2-epimerase (non-hydrolyzing) [bacterium]|nr:UDP-N-acetylglucosamine 2-epimerase (non-hydrolyzing) [bacterium]